MVKLIRRNDEVFVNVDGVETEVREHSKVPFNDFDPNEVHEHEGKKFRVVKEAGYSLHDSVKTSEGEYKWSVLADLEASTYQCKMTHPDGRVESISL